MSSNPTPKPCIRIRGVVAAHNRVQALLKQGIPSDQAPAFRAEIRSVVESVERICRQHKTPVEALPPPTFHAYQYLKSLLKGELPKPPKNQQKKSEPIEVGSNKSLRISGLIAFCQGLQDLFSQLAQQSPATWDNVAKIKLLPAYQEIQSALKKLDQIAQNQKRPISSLPAPSFRAYQWLSFLSHPKNLQAHLQALNSLYAIEAASAHTQNKPVPKNLPSLKVEFFHIAGLYRVQYSGPVSKLVAHEAYIFAPKPILESLVLAARHAKQPSALSQIRAYADGPEFMLHSQQLTSIGLHPSSQAVGIHQDLQQIFERVNARYFDNQLNQPQLSWSQSLTYRKYGHYQPSTDSLMLSASLDNPKIPDYVLDFAMYHELLHKHLGYYTINNRRFAHHAAFRELEAQFPQYEEAIKYLGQIGKRIKKDKFNH